MGTVICLIPIETLVAENGCMKRYMSTGSNKNEWTADQGNNAFNKTVTLDRM